MQVISKLTDGKATHIPYRDSKLTRLLQSSLSGHGRVSVSTEQEFLRLSSCKYFIVLTIPEYLFDYLVVIVAYLHCDSCL